MNRAKGAGKVSTPRVARWRKTARGKIERRPVSPFRSRSHRMCAHYTAVVGISEVDIDREEEERLKQQELDIIREWKRKKREARWASQPSKAPLDSQESCTVS